ncbi:zymogen granule protein 16 homolog B [Sus scrofa]|uniref:Zymogen granule protein 16B n=2 Tax=Sus scrofa TaxID=9823 RepID=A0A4X1VVM5_PIG|nr:zymogen granule protein 16 homolog B [Sus scrofa]
MLLWLTLTLLWSSPCWAGQTYGIGGGSYFSTSKDNESEITGIRVYIGLVGLIKSIQVRYGSSWSEKYGSPGGNAQEFILQPGEHIIAVYGTYRLYLRYLVLYTDFDRWATFGEKTGQEFFAYPDASEKVLTGLFGHHKLLGITDIGFQWDYPLIDVTSAQPDTTYIQNK